MKTSAYVPQVYDAVYAYYLAFDKLARQGKISVVCISDNLANVVNIVLRGLEVSGCSRIENCMTANCQTKIRSPTL